MKTRIYSSMMAVVLSLGALMSVGVAKPAEAASGKEKTWKIATYALGAASVYALAKNKDTLALIGGAGTYVASQQWKKAANDRRKNQRFSKARSYRRR